MSEGGLDLRDAAAASFGGIASAYAAARPQYPLELFDWIAETCRARDAAWDCAAGSGQASSGLAERFGRVYPSDLSADLLRLAARRDNVFPVASRAEAAPFKAGAFDMIAVAQALHWFDHPRFWNEVRRVGRPGGLFCAWGYVVPEAPPEIEARLIAPFRMLIAPFWAAQNGLLWRGYRPDELGFPFEVVSAPRFAIRADWTLSELVAFMSTWSAYQRARRDAATSEALDRLFEQAGALAAASDRLPIAFPLELLAGRI